MARRKSPALMRAEKQLASARMRARKLAKQYNQPPITKIGMQVTGGALSGAARVYSPIKDVMGLPIDTIGGLILVGYGSFNNGKMAQGAIDIGSGMLAASASRFTEDYLGE